jgi:hypothetical protein
MVCAAQVVMQRCGKRISSAVDQQATTEEAMFSAGAAPRLNIEDLTQLELELSSIPELAVCRRNGKEGIRLCERRLHSVLQ